jgi:hypothetical protein
MFYLMGNVYRMSPEFELKGAEIVFWSAEIKNIYLY